MLAPIIPAKTAIRSFRDSGYKNTAAAIAEIIDNSIEAKAKNIKILVFEKDEKIRRGGKRISEIAIVDDGIGMDEKILSTSLQFGNGTKLATRKGIGRFGIGLPNASISQCQNIITKYNLRPIISADTAGSAKFISENNKTSEVAIASSLSAKI